MANELSITIRVTHNAGGGPADYKPTTFQVTQSTVKKVANTQTIGTSAENIVLGDVSSPGFAMLTNLDGTNYVQIGKDVSASFEELCRIDPGETVLLCFDGGVTPQAMANTAPVELDYVIFSR